MGAIYVCSLDKLGETAQRSGASHIATLINADTPVPRPETVEEKNHLFLGFNDIVTPTNGMTPPAAEHVERFLEFVRSWDQVNPMIVHCWAGVSRSTAGAMIATCALRPELDEALIANTIRARSKEATPNIRLIGFADDLLNRQGRMVDAVEKIGRGESCFEGSIFNLGITGQDNDTL
ncbi:MAG: protein tyrosine phosphatase [Hyphomicrobiales bacterium]|nr:protein tyrosine phosphatase [Hyphomicrobiales bacterium]PCJ84003.1 MAG: protein tyrosine phosphatase [Hyphomicrobiales bacterium]